MADTVADTALGEIVFTKPENSWSGLVRLAARLGVEPEDDGEVVITIDGVNYSLFPLLHAFLDKMETDS